MNGYVSTRGRDLGCHLSQRRRCRRDLVPAWPSVPERSVPFLQTFLSTLEAVVHPKKLVLQALLVGPHQTALHTQRDAAGLTGDLIPNSSQPLWETRRETAQCPNEPDKVPPVC